MNAVLRALALGPESLVYGPSYGIIKYLIRSPRPLDPDKTWKFITSEIPPVMD